MHQNTMAIMLPYVIPDTGLQTNAIPPIYNPTNSTITTIAATPATPTTTATIAPTENVNSNDNYKEIPPPYSEVVMDAPPSYIESSRMKEKLAQ